ncbi:MAG: hypothetical protein QOD32_563, partial [Pyrinomonadaceae bacterium]|nr:hypothetical protein [Pyrinomonadaceae bacterium]
MTHKSNPAAPAQQQQQRRPWLAAAAVGLAHT